jgi:hypothetical protein
MLAYIQLALPVVVILAFVQWKLNHTHKGWLWKVPLVWSSTALSLAIGHAAGGVMGIYAALFCDLLLYPGMLMLKRLWERKEKKLKGAGRLQQAPACLPAVASSMV